MGDNRETRTPTASNKAKILLRTVKDLENAPPPLKSVAGGLCNILGKHEAWFNSQISPEPQSSEPSQRAQGNKRAIESLAPRVKSLAEFLCTPIPEGDAGEESRRGTLEQ